MLWFKAAAAAFIVIFDNRGTGDCCGMAGLWLGQSEDRLLGKLKNRGWS